MTVKQLSPIRFLPRIIAGVSIAIIAAAVAVIADEPRAPAPKFSAGDTRGIFFDSIEDAFRGERPSLSSIRKQSASSQSAASQSASKQNSADDHGSDSGSNDWSKLISPASLEDEIKRVRLHFDATITTPGAFNGGGFKDARVDLSVLAVMFAIIDIHGGDVRWKDEAGAARDLLARTAFNCKAGSTQVFNEAKLRKADLQDLVSGSGFTGRDSEEVTDWSSIVDRVPMMTYAESTLESLKGLTNDEAKAKSNLDQIRRDAEVLAVIGNVLIQEGMDDFDDSDYATLSRAMIASASSAVTALERSDFDGVRKSVGAITQSCDACHEQYR